MWWRLFIDYDIIVFLEIVCLVLFVLDVEGVFVRSCRCLYWWVYFNKGLNFVIYMDGWDKFKLFGILIYGVVDGYLWCVLWLCVCNLNKNL